jgi:hypothetical protein
MVQPDIPVQRKSVLKERRVEAMGPIVESGNHDTVYT